MPTSSLVLLPSLSHTHPDAIAKPMTSSHYFTPLAKFQIIWRRLCEALLSSSSLACQKHPPLLSRLCLKFRICTGRIALNMKIKRLIISADTVDALTATFAVHRRRADRVHKSRLALRETGDRLTGTYSGGSLDRTESVPKWSREQRAGADQRKAPRRDKAVCSLSLNHSRYPET